MIKVGIVGGTGYTGAELLRLLVRHSEVSLQVITSRGEAGREVADLFPNLRGHLALRFSEPDLATLAACDLVLFATPNGTAMEMVPDLLAAGTRVIDLAADFRLRDPAQWKAWYGLDHHCPELLKEAVYGLPELYREEIREARLIANPGCYPTAVTLALLPLIESAWIDSSDLIADVKSGSSGAGRKAQVRLLMAESGEDFKAYAAAGHRHQPEIVQTLSSRSERPVELLFLPHLLPMIRGIHATLYARLEGERSLEGIHELFAARYRDEPFVDLLPLGAHPETRSVRGINVCRLALHRQGGRVIVLSVIDNLVKGAAGQAVQNLNLMFGLPEGEALDGVALLP